MDIIGGAHDSAAYRTEQEKGRGVSGLRQAQNTVDVWVGEFDQRDAFEAFAGFLVESLLGNLSRTRAQQGTCE